eukprot:Selendium_serpulae@DN413_c0_g1_i2.p1
MSRARPEFQLFWDGFQWTPRAGAGGGEGNNRIMLGQMINASEKERTLILENLPHTSSEVDIRALIFDGLVRYYPDRYDRQATAAQVNPIVSVSVDAQTFVTKLDTTGAAGTAAAGPGTTGAGPGTGTGRAVEVGPQNLADSNRASLQAAGARLVPAARTGTVTVLSGEDAHNLLRLDGLDWPAHLVRSGLVGDEDVRQTRGVVIRRAADAAASMQSKWDVADVSCADGSLTSSIAAAVEQAVATGNAAGLRRLVDRMPLDQQGPVRAVIAKALPAALRPDAESLPLRERCRDNRRPTGGQPTGGQLAGGQLPA